MTWSRGTRSIDVDCEVEAVGLVVDCQLQRSVDAAEFLVAAHVQVVVIGSAVGELVNQPRISVKIEDHRLAESEQLSKSRSVSPCGCSLLGCSLNRSTTLTKRIFRSGIFRARSPPPRAPPSSPRRPRSLSPRQARLLVVARPVPDPMPLVQCLTAASMSRNCRCGCLSATITLT